MISGLKNVVLRVSKQKAAFSLQNVGKVLTTDITKTTATTTPAAISGIASRNYATTPDFPENIVDIDGDTESMMVEGDDEDVTVAPTDIDAWADEEEVKQGTLDIDEAQKPEFEYPAIPLKRSGIYEFKGIKIILPQKMLRNEATYRWRIDPEDQSTPCDDIRICNFEPKEKK